LSMTKCDSLERERCARATKNWISASADAFCAT